MAPTLILISESRTTLSPHLHKQFTLHHARSGKQAIQHAQQHTQTEDNLIFLLNADSLGTTGRRICRQLRNAYPQAHIVHICPPDTPQQANPCADLTFTAPITSRQLINALKRLSNTRPSRTLIHCAGFILDVQSRILTAHGEDIPLNPKQTALVAFFFKHPNQTFTREQLMREVWQTDYAGDTRTLSVHIRWLRKALEPEQATSPRYLITVRGIGYRLEVPLKKAKQKNNSKANHKNHNSTL